MKASSSVRTSAAVPRRALKTAKRRRAHEEVLVEASRIVAYKGTSRGVSTRREVEEEASASEACRGKPHERTWLQRPDGYFPTDHSATGLLE
jgi:hypothetical protein